MRGRTSSVNVLFSAEVDEDSRAEVEEDRSILKHACFGGEVQLLPQDWTLEARMLEAEEVEEVVSKPNPFRDRSSL